MKYNKHYAPQDPAYHANSLVTERYPYAQPMLSDHNRGKLHNAIDDCILCDKCAHVCPTNCITIEKERHDNGEASNGMPKRFQALRFDIHLNQCCFCGLCTQVCPTECLIMLPDYAYSSSNPQEHQLHFAP